MYLAIIIMPLLSSIISGFFGRNIGVKGSHFISCSTLIVTTLVAIATFMEADIYNTFVSLYIFKWIDTELLNIYWALNFDSLTVSMLIPVLVVSSLVHIYSIDYMSHDPHNQRFFSYLSLFTFMMVILVTSNNYLLMFVGWEGVGICSYLLVSFWFTRIAANQSSISAMLTNRVGDCLLTIGMFAIIWSLGNLDYATVFSLAPFYNKDIVTIIGICLLIGAMAKSSQLGLHVWLPMAMEGPTPVSALIHAATMVTAGVYLLIRSSPLIEYSSTVLLLSLWIGALTTLFSSLIGLFQQDIKKVIAYSTMSQLGLMVVAVGLSSYHVALFHLINHAFYKALLFLGAGAVIHGIADNQDFRKYGGLKQFLPLSYSVMLIASLSLVAFPYMTGFFSKDLILESSYGGYNLVSITVYYIATIGAMFTTLYSVKTLYLTFIANPNGYLIGHKNVHEGNIAMNFPLVLLALASIYFGFIYKDLFIGLGSDLFRDNSIFIHPVNEIMLNTEFAVPTIFKLLPLIFTISLTIISIIISVYMFKGLINFKYSRFGYNIFSFFNLRFLVELLYNKYITENILKLGGQTTRILDKGAVELIGPYGLQVGFTTLSKNLNSLNNGLVTSYALYILVGALSYISISYISAPGNENIIMIFIMVMSMISYLTVKNKGINTIPNKTLKFNTFIENDNRLRSSILESLIITINKSFKQYIKNFNLKRLILGVIKLKLITLSLAYIICLDCIFYNSVLPLNGFFTQNVFYISNSLIILLILIYFLITPLKNKINYLSILTFNLLIINFIIISFIILILSTMYKIGVNIDDIYNCNNLFDTIVSFIYLSFFAYNTLPSVMDSGIPNTDILYMVDNTGSDSGDEFNEGESSNTGSNLAGSNNAESNNSTSNEDEANKPAPSNTTPNESETSNDKSVNTSTEDDSPKIEFTLKQLEKYVNEVIREVSKAEKRPVESKWTIYAKGDKTPDFSSDEYSDDDSKDMRLKSDISYSVQDSKYTQTILTKESPKDPGLLAIKEFKSDEETSATTSTDKERATDDCKDDKN